MNKNKSDAQNKPKVGRPFLGATERVHGTLTPHQRLIFDNLGGFAWLRKCLDLSKGLSLENKSKKDLQ